MISKSVSQVRPAAARFQPLVSLLVLLCASLVSVSLATQGGAHVFQLIKTYITDWPLLLFSLLTVTAGVFCHNMDNIINNINIINRTTLTNYSASHLSVILTTILPIICSVSLLM